jgi:hypothetical protein
MLFLGALTHLEAQLFPLIIIYNDALLVIKIVIVFNMNVFTCICYSHRIIVGHDCTYWIIIIVSMIQIALFCLSFVCMFALFAFFSRAYFIISICSVEYADNK